MQAWLARTNIHPNRTDGVRLAASLVLALLFWGWVTTSKDPETDRSFANVPVVAGDLPAPLTVVGEIPDITVKVTGPRSTVSGLISNDVTATLNLEGIDEPGDYTVPILVQAPNGVWHESASPGRLPIRVDNSVTRQFVVQTTISGNVDSTRQVTATVVDASEITAVGPQSSIDRVAKVVAPIEIESQSRDFTAAVTPEALDADGQPIPEVSLTPNIVTVNVAIDARGKRVAVLTQLDGEPAQGYEVVDRTINPATVLVDGPTTTLESLISVSTEPIDVSGATTTVTRRARITALPEGVHVLEPSDGAVDVVVQVRQIGVRQPLTPQTVRVVGLGPGLSATASPDSLAITVVASEDALSALTTNTLAIQVNVDGLGPGVYQLKPNVALPANMTWVDADAASVTVTITTAATVAPTGSPQASPSPAT